MDRKKTKVEARKLKGFQDYDSATMEKRLHIIQTVRDIGRKALFQEIATPALEYTETLLGVGGETDKQIFRFTDNGGRDVALRYDLTVPFARYVAERHGSLPLPFKRLQTGDVWRAEKPQKGRYREFAQCDLDIIGSDDPAADTEVLLCIHEAICQMMPYPFTIACGNRILLSGLLTQVLQTSEHEKALIIIDKLDKIGEEAVTNMLCQELSVQPAAVSHLLAILRQQQSIDLSPWPELLAEKERFQNTIKTLQTLTQGTHGAFVEDLSIARGLGYYTGIVFETTVNERKEFGSICSGGRYDRLCERFTDAPLAGVGGSIGVDRLTALLTDLGFELSHTQPSVYIAIATEGAFSYGFSLAHTLRRAGYPTDLPLKKQKVGQQFKTANRMGFPWVITVGDDEMASRTFCVKNMRTGEEKRGLPVGELINFQFGMA